MPHSLKELIVRGYAHRHALSLFIETGTFHGDMIAAVKDHFALMYSIELDGQLYAEARQRFAAYSYIHVLCGNSGWVLPELLAALKRPALFWLDGHYSGEGTARGTKDSPILEELMAILHRPDQAESVILIDDARFFTGCDGYPTMAELQSIVQLWTTRRHVEMDEDVIRITPCAGITPCA